MKLLKSKKGFTLMEAMITIGIMGVVSVGLFRLMNDGFYMFSFGTARMALATEARLTTAALTKFVQAVQGTTVNISRYDTSQPVNSYIAGKLAENVFVTTTRGQCCSNAETEQMTMGGAGDDLQIYQYGGKLFARKPYLLPGTDITNQAAIKANTRYQTLTLTANCETFNAVYQDSGESTTINFSVKLSKKIYGTKPPIVLFFKKAVVIKHMHSAGYYGN